MCVTWAKTRMYICSYLTNEGDRFLLSLCYVGCGGGHFRVLAGRIPSRTGFLTPFQLTWLLNLNLDLRIILVRNEDIGRARTNKTHCLFFIFKSFLVVPIEGDGSTYKMLKWSPWSNLKKGANWDYFESTVGKNGCHIRGGIITGIIGIRKRYWFWIKILVSRIRNLNRTVRSSLLITHKLQAWELQQLKAIAALTPLATVAAELRRGGEFINQLWNPPLKDRWKKVWRFSPNRERNWTGSEPFCPYKEKILVWCRLFNDIVRKSRSIGESYRIVLDSSIESLPVSAE